MTRKGNAKQRICGAVLQLLTEKSVKNMTVAEIVRRAGINRSTYYYYFYEPEDVVDCMVEGFIGSLLGCFRASLSSRGEDFPRQPLTAGLCEVIYQERQLVSVMLGSPEYRGMFEGRVMNEIELFLRQYVLIAADTGGDTVRVGRGVEFDYYRYFIAAGTIAVMCMWSDEGFEMTPEEASDSLMEFSSLELIGLEKRGARGRA